MEISRRRLMASGAAAVTPATAAPLVASAATRAASARHDPRLPDPARIDVTDPADLSLLQCASLLQAGRLSSRELTRACLDRGRARDGATTAWIRVYPEYAEKLAAQADQRLATARRQRRTTPLVTGVPLALKDIIAAKGLPLTASSAVLEGNIAQDDSTVWARLKAAGMVLLGHAETDEFAFGTSTPQTANPWDVDKSAGGSSGGSGSLLGARLVPAALGTDTGGSLRFPASVCGITALKPSFGRVSAHGVIPLVWARDHVGPMGRSAGDAALLLTYLAGHDVEDPATLGAPAIPRRGYLGTPTKGSKPFAGMRFGVSRADVADLPAATGAIFARFLTEVQQLGARLVDVEMPPRPTGGNVKASLVELGEAGVYHSQFAPASTGRYRLENQAAVAASIAASQAASSGDVVRYQQDRAGFQRAYNRMFERHRLTVVLVPGTTLDGATRSDLAGITLLTENVAGNVVWGNDAGVPVLCTPVGRSKATGIPFGVQIGARAWQEAGLLQVALDYQHHFAYWKQAPKPLLEKRAIPTARVVTPPKASFHDPTGTVATRPGVAIVPTLATAPLAYGPLSGIA